MSEFVWNDAEFYNEFEAVDGMVARELERRAQSVQQLAQQYASGMGGGPNVRTGRLRASIAASVGEDAAGLFAAVTAEVEYGQYLERGTSKMRPRPFLEPALRAAE